MSSPFSDGYFNSLAPGKLEWNFRHVILKQILMIDAWGVSYEIALTWKPQNLTDDKSTLGNGLDDPVLCCHMALLGLSEFN